MKRLTWLMLVLLPVFSSIVVSAAPSPHIGTPASGVKVASQADWAKKWEKTLAEARKEGVVRLYTQWGANTRRLLSQGFKDRYGIELESIPFARGSDLLARYQAEKRAGLNLADVFGTGATTLITMMKPAGVLGPLEPMLVLPEIVEPRNWSEGRVPFVDKDRLVIGMLSSLLRYIAYNTDLVKEGEIAGYKDVLNPRYRGKISMADPSLTGTANTMFAHMVRLWGMEEASEFLRKLIRQQEVVVQREHRQVVEWVARGKHSVGLAGQTEAVAEFLKLGAPIALVVQKEGHAVNEGAGALSVPKVAAHPHATRVFVNWLLTKEGQTAFAVKGYGTPSRRVDVPNEGINPLFVPNAEEKLFYSNEEEIILKGKLLKVAKKILDETK